MAQDEAKTSGMSSQGCRCRSEQPCVKYRGKSGRFLRSALRGVSGRLRSFARSGDLPLTATTTERPFRTRHPASPIVSTAVGAPCLIPRKTRARPCPCSSLPAASWARHRSTFNFQRLLPSAALRYWPNWSTLLGFLLSTIAASAVSLTLADWHTSLKI